MKTIVGVIVVTYQSKDVILSCLSSLVNDQGSPAVTVVDNASQDGTVSLIRTHFPWVKIVEVPKNAGFAAGVNIGLRQCADASYVFLVNPDAVIKPGVIPQLVEFAQRNPTAGIIGPQVFDDNACMIRYPSCRRFPTLSAAVFGNNSLLTRLFGLNRFSRSYLYADENLSEPRIVDWVSGCAMFLRREIINQIGFFDEHFFFYYEDIDYCWRAHKAGWQVMYVPGISIVHLQGKSAKSVPYLALWAKHVGMVTLYRKHVRRTFLTDPIVYVGGWARLGLLMGREALRRVSLQ